MTSRSAVYLIRGFKPTAAAAVLLQIGSHPFSPLASTFIASGCVRSLHFTLRRPSNQFSWLAWWSNSAPPWARNQLLVKPLHADMIGTF